MTTSLGLAIAALVVSVVVATVNGRSALAAQKAMGATNLKIAQGEEENTAGHLALDYARQISSRVSSLEEWREETVETWWPKHALRDKAIEAELLKLDPTAKIPPDEPLPRMKKPRGEAGQP